MGLDIYLYRYDNYNHTKELENKYNEFSEKLWNQAGPYESMSQEEKDVISAKCKEYSLSLGLDEWGSDKTNREQIEQDHSDYPDHYFKIGYFRSSYNSGGIEQILRNLGLPTLHDIFKNEDEEYQFQPNWEESLSRCEEVIKMFREKGAYRVNHVSQNMFSKPNIHSEKEALDIFMSELNKHKDEKYNYSNSNGEFNFGEPVKVLAMIPGTTRIFKEEPCVYVVTESDNIWYIQALEIVRDTIKYVLSKENKEQYYLHWSG